VLQFLRRFKNPIVSAICIALPFFFLNANLRDPTELGPFDRFLLRLSAPLQSAVGAVAEAAAEVWEKYVYLIAVAEENDRLRHENARLREEVHRLGRDGLEARRLRRMLEFRETFEEDLVSARVIGVERNPTTHRVMRIGIDRGSRLQVRPGMPVVTHAGLVGEIRRAAGEWADVLLAVDSSCRVAGVVERTGAHGVLEGSGRPDRYAIDVEHLDAEHEVRVGDLVHTSGEDRKFPKGILVGRISAMRRRARALLQEAQVRPAVDFTRLDEVFVVLTGPAAPAVTASAEGR
jgi:rod shape-determining protein MreC